MIRTYSAEPNSRPNGQGLSERGWALLPGFLGRDEVERLSDELRSAEASSADAAGLLFLDRLANGEVRLARIERVLDVLDRTTAGMLTDRMGAIARRCLGGCAMLFKDKLNIRHPGGPGYAPHQDAARWDDYASRFVSIGLFLGPSDPERGGFEFAQVRPDVGRMANRRGDIDRLAFEELPRTAVRADAGDAILIEGDAPHRTFDNVSGETVRHLLITYARSEAPDLRDRFYEGLRRDFAEIREGNRFVFPAR